MKKLSKKLNLAPTASLFLKVVIVAGLVGLWVYAFFFAPSGNPDRIENGEWIEKAELVCSQALDEISLLPLAKESRTPADRADVIAQGTQVLEKMKNVGLHGLPGGGAELLVDDIRLDISPKKGGSENWLRIMEEAQSLGLVTSATNVIGFGETNGDRISHMDKIRKLQDSTIKNGFLGFTSFISWPVQLENNVFGKRNKGNNRLELETGPKEYLRHVAISRLFFDNIDHIQASWPTMGLGIAQMAFFAGADDAGSTMMEENVVSASGTDKTQANEIELQRTILRAGFIPSKRDSEYNLIPVIVTPDNNISAIIPVQN